MSKPNFKPCPFCRAASWGDESNREMSGNHYGKPSFMLWHAASCFFGNATLLVVGSEQARRWNKRPK